MTKHECCRCGYRWIGRLETPPKSCPCCKSYKWHTPKEDGREQRVEGQAMDE